uniref:RhbA n=1 Tax=Cereibacter sphaeroides TaxID=1063 RepID=Q9RFF8_CERSP|nr:RhbA [Cereibacter sphaeroides]
MSARSLPPRGAAHEPAMPCRTPSAPARWTCPRVSGPGRPAAGASGPAYRLFYERPLHIVRGEGVWLYDADGTAYLDAYNNVASLGHCHPRVVDAVARQAGQLRTHTRYLHEGVLELPSGCCDPAHRARARDVHLHRVGGERPGPAARLRRHRRHGCDRDRERLSRGDDGRGGPLALAGSGRAARRPCPHRACPRPGQGRRCDLRRGRGGGGRRSGPPRHPARGADPRHGLLLRRGLHPPDGHARPGGGGDPRGGRALHRRRGAARIRPHRRGDVGLPRHGVVPDMVSMGKPMGNGYPVAALALRPELAERFGAGARYFNTFGGNAVAAAAALAVLDTLEAEGLQAHALNVGGQFRADLSALSARDPRLGAVRGAGLFLGVEVLEPESRAPDARMAAAIVNGLREARVLISATGPHGHVLKIRPPLVFSDANAAFFLERFESVLAALR